MVPNGHTTTQMRVGQWEVEGTCTFYKVSIRQADALAFDTPGVGVLGSNEKIEDGVYTSSFTGSLYTTTNYHRTIANLTAPFNTNRFPIYNGAYIQLAHSGIPFTGAGSFTVNIGYYTSGNLNVFCKGSTATAWTSLGSVGAATTKKFLLPSTACTDIMMQGDTSSSLQVYSWEFSAPCSGTTDTTGDQVMLTSDCPPESVSPGCDVMVLFNHGGTYNHDRNSYSTLDFTVSNSGSSNANYNVNATPADSHTQVTVTSGASGSVKAGQTASFTIKYLLAAGNAQVVYLTLQAGSSAVLTESWLTFSAINNLYDVSYGEKLPSPLGSTVWWCGSTYKIYQYRTAPTTTASSVAVSAARNEYESFQLVVRGASGQGVSIGQIIVHDFSGSSTISADEVTVKEVVYVHTEQASDYLGVAGEWWPDPLPPVETPIRCPADTNCPLWVTLHVPEDTKAGSYKGGLDIQFTTAGSTVTASVTITLQVYNFTIPKHTSLMSWFGLGSGVLQEYFHTTSSNETETVFNKYLDHMSAHRIAPNNPIQFHDIWGDVQEDANGNEYWVYYLDEFDKHYKTYFDDDGYGFTMYTAYLQGMGSGQGDEWVPGDINGHVFGTSEYTKLFNDYASTVQDFLDKRGLLPKTIIYWFDEPSEADYQHVKEGNEAINDAAPKLNRFLTEEPIEQLYGYVDTWSPVISNYDYMSASARQAKGEKICTYVCCCPKAPYLGLFIDHPATELRLWLWMTFKFNTDAILIWSANYWTSSVAYPNGLQNPYDDPMSWVSGYGVTTHEPWGNGDGRLFYPPRHWDETDKPILDEDAVDSMRVEILRDGIEDWEYLTLLQQLVADRGDSLSDDLAARAKELLTVPDDIFVDARGEFTWDASLITDRRNAIAEVIEEIYDTNAGSALAPSRLVGIVVVPFVLVTCWSGM
eukprot:TRINITY_DN986_c1_g1_i2.p1 TRINITY_DN986_c1_g1~~TRINITY_DN986_c1_g1_i2.p1  ORF type:complete len:922 (+),score=112.78 TRINITY_DN986_c1_g1_i2:471-3236(+)